MVFFEPFAVERWMDEYETKATHDLAETCSLSLPLNDVLQWSRDDGEPALDASDFFSKRMGYGHIAGSPKLRQNIASLYNGSIKPDNVLVTQGAIGANFLAIVSLVSKGDHVICVHPTYQQLYELPKTFGADVDLWRLRPETQWQHQLQDLERILTKKTSLVIINNPNNPTGQVIPTETLSSLAGLVKEKAAPGALILCDEVYRPLFHSLDTGNAAPPSILELGLDNVIATGSLSKAFSLAGLRVGWIATARRDVLQRFHANRDYNTISVSGVDDELAARALGKQCRAKILQRNIELARANRAMLQKWVETPGRGTSWVPTRAGTTALVYLGQDIDDEAFCRALNEERGVVSPCKPSSRAALDLDSDLDPSCHC